jgi:hypothetical protein
VNSMQQHSVLLLRLSHFEGVRLFWFCGVCSTLSPVFTNILPATHAVKGCDTTSLLFGIGKRGVFKVLKENPDYFKDLSWFMSFSQPNCKGLLGGGFVRWHDTKHKSGVTL